MLGEDVMKHVESIIKVGFVIRDVMGNADKVTRLCNTCIDR
jgi:hypothetical protein